MLKSIGVTICLALPIILAASSPFQKMPVEFLAVNTTTKNCNGTLATYQWVYSNVNQQLPNNSIYGGFDKNQNVIYVGRAYHDGLYWPASIVPAKRTAYITVKGKHYTKDTFEVLTGDNFWWEMGYDGYTPWASISTAPGYWIGRAVYKNALIVGKVGQKEKTCLVSYDNKQQSNSKYEVLVYRGPYFCTCKF